MSVYNAVCTSVKTPATALLIINLEIEPRLSDICKTMWILMFLSDRDVLVHINMHTPLLQSLHCEIKTFYQEMKAD